MIYAPVAIHTLCRYEHFKREVESLKRNSYAKFTDVFIALDYPAKESHWDGYNKIADYLEHGDFSAFKSFNVIKREKNYGPGVNSTALIDEVIIPQYDRWISCEDDLEFAPNFLEYMDKNLLLFEKDEKVIAINGYTYDVPWKLKNNGNEFLQQYTFSAWGCAFWKDKYLKIKGDIESNILLNSYKQAKQDHFSKKMISGRYYDYLEYVFSGNKDSLYTKMADVTLGIYMNLTNTFVVTPSISKVRNFGFDGTGVYCGEIKNISGNNSLEYDYCKQAIDNNTDFNVNITELSDFDINKKIIGDFLFVSERQKRKVRLLKFFSAFMGLDNVQRLYQFLKTKKEAK